MKIQIELGVLSPSVSKQLKGVFPSEKLAIFDRLSDAITRLHIFGLITDGESTRARKRLIKFIQRKLDETRRQTSVRL